MAATAEAERGEQARPGSQTRVKTPTVLQMQVTECGAASLGMVLGHYGCWVPLEELRERCGASRDGTTASDLVKTGAQFGLTAKGYYRRRGLLPELGYPLILLWKGSHFLVLEGLDDKHAWLNDPASGQRRIPARRVRPRVLQDLPGLPADVLLPRGGRAAVAPPSLAAPRAARAQRGSRGRRGGAAGRDPGPGRRSRGEAVRRRRAGPRAHRAGVAARGGAGAARAGAAGDPLVPAAHPDPAGQSPDGRRVGALRPPRAPPARELLRRSLRPGPLAARAGQPRGGGDPHRQARKRGHGPRRHDRLRAGDDRGRSGARRDRPRADRWSTSPSSARASFVRSSSRDCSSASRRR